MADTPFQFTPSSGKKRSRDDDDVDGYGFDAESRFDKKARPDSGHASLTDSWIQGQGSVVTTPVSFSNAEMRGYQKPQYDSDDQSSMFSEAGSHQDIAMSPADEDMEDSEQSSIRQPHNGLWHPWPTRLQANRVPTPILPPPTSRPSVRPIQVQSCHIRHRHPQEYMSGGSSDLLEVPSPIDEDEVPTPPSAADAAGSQLSMLTVNDMDMESSYESGVPTISIDQSQPLPFNEGTQQSFEMESAIIDEFEPMESAGGAELGLIVRKQRARSGALSSPHGSPSPVRGESMRSENNGSVANHRRGVSMGFRADCEKCQMRVPGHMNHFIT